MLYFNLSYQKEISDLKNHPNQEEGWFQRHSWMNKPLFLSLIYLLILFIFSLACIIIHFAFPPESPFVPSLGCIQSQIYSMVLQAILATSALIYYIVKLWNMEDALFVKREMVLVVAVVPLLFVFFVLSFLLAWDTAIHIFTTLAPFYAACVTLYYPSILALLVIRRNRIDQDLVPAGKSSGGEVFYQGEETFLLCLRSEETLLPFINFCVKSWCVETILFYLEVEKFSKLENNKELLAKEAKAIVDRYVAEGAPLEVNLEFEMRRNILNRVSTGDLHPEMFQRCQKHVFKVMYHDTYIQWKRTKEFRELVPEGQTVRSIKSITKKRKRANSRASQKTDEILPPELGIKMEDLIDPSTDSLRIDRE